MTGAGTAATLGYPDFGLRHDVGDGRQRRPHRRRGRSAGHRRRRYRLRQRAQHRAHGARIRGAPGSPASISRTRAFRRNAAISTTRRSCRARNGWPRSAPPPRPAAAPTSRSSPAPTRAPSIGFDEAIARANAALAAGADMAFVEAPQTMEEVAAVPRLRQGPVPPQRRARRQDPGPRPRARPSAWATSWRSSPAC